jgi:ABC-type lipoprotein release transport system permease subunit
MKVYPLSYAWKKTLKETSWSLIIIAIMSVGQTGWIAVPSIGSSLQSAVQDYGNAVATYVVVENNGNPSTLNVTLPQTLLQQIRSVPGIQEVYPIATNYSIFFNPPSIVSAVVGNKTIGIQISSLGIHSAVVGGETGYPKQLLDIAAGRAPSGNEAGFVYNSNEANPYKLGDTAQVQISGVNFTAKEVGINKYIPLIGNNLGVLWNSSFVESKLGSVLFHKTFSQKVNTVIIKVDSVQDVPGAVSGIKNLTANYSDYLVIYDQATVDNLLSLQNGVAPLYELLGLLSLAFAIVAVFVVSYVAINRRSWEVGLLLTQGWSWKDVRSYFFFHFLALGVISLALSIFASVVISRFSGATYEVYGGYQVISITVGLGYVVVAAVMIVGLATASAAFVTWKLRKAGLDRVLREF